LLAKIKLYIRKCQFMPITMTRIDSRRPWSPHIVCVIHRSARQIYQLRKFDNLIHNICRSQYGRSLTNQISISTVNSNRTIHCFQIESVSGMIYSLTVRKLPLHTCECACKIRERIVSYAPSLLFLHSWDRLQERRYCDRHIQSSLSLPLDSTAFCCLTTGALPSSPVPLHRLGSPCRFVLLFHHFLLWLSFHMRY